jgi:hypothetical protein
MKGQNKITYNVSAEEILEELPLKDFIFFEKVFLSFVIFWNGSQDFYFIRFIMLYKMRQYSKISSAH